MPQPSAPAHPVPVPASDPLFADTLRAALESYLRGDYRKAADYFLDAAAVGQHRPEWDAWRTLGTTIRADVDDGPLVNVDSAIPRDAQVRR